MLTIYPAIDLKGGACVRLRRGDMADATVYSADPAAQAKAWQDAGCQWLHVVDLDGALAGASVNRDAVQAILAAAEVPVQLGGGIRDRAGVEQWLAAGIRRVILGSAAVKNPALVREAARAHPGRIVVGIDARDGRVATEGWAEASTLTAIEIARRFEQDGVAAIIYTEILRDGMLGGVDIAGTLALARAVRIPVIASGGIGEASHLHDLVQQAAGALEGVILGRALYDGRIGVQEALRIAAV
jgi:phosphoribosylformimino-5-aminoimidazole carboxamide ribotide isomerase